MLFKPLFFAPVAFLFLLSHVHADTLVSLGIDDFHGLNTRVSSGEASNNHMYINQSFSGDATGLSIIMGGDSSISNRASSLGRDGYGTGTSTFGRTEDWFDGSYAKVGNSGNQMLIDYMIVNDTAQDFKYRILNFDIRKDPANTNPTSWEHLYLTGNTNYPSTMVKGPSAAAGSELANLKVIGSNTIAGGINSVGISIAEKIEGTGWIAAGDRASFRIKVIGGTGSAQIDNFAVQGTLVPEPSAFALITGVLVMATLATRRRHK